MDSKLWDYISELYCIMKYQFIFDVIVATALIVVFMRRRTT